MTEAAKQRARLRIQVIKIQWFVILALIIALIITIATRAATSTTDSPQVTTTVNEPVIVATPMAQKALSAPANPVSAEKIELPFTELGEFKTTAYCTCVKCCGIWSQEHPSRQGTDYIQRTASGAIPTAGRTVAVDTNVIPFGTVIVIDGHEYVAEDTGSAVKGNTIDIYFDNHKDAENYGVQYKTIYIKGE